MKRRIGLFLILLTIGLYFACKLNYNYSRRGGGTHEASGWGIITAIAFATGGTLFMKEEVK